MNCSVWPEARTAPDWVEAETAAKVPSAMTSADWVRAMTELPSGTTATISTREAPRTALTVAPLWNRNPLLPRFRSPLETMTIEP